MKTTPGDRDSLHRLINMHTHKWNPPTDVFETDDYIIVRVEIAGMMDDDFAIELDGRLLSIRGIRQDPPERRAFHQMEIPFGEFHIRVSLPTPIEHSRTEAIYANGFLRIMLPKSQPRQISIGE